MSQAKIRVGNAPVSWGVMEVAGWGKQIPYSQLLNEIQQAGYAGTELGPYGYFPTDPETLALELSARHLQLIASSSRSFNTSQRCAQRSNGSRTSVGAGRSALNCVGG